MGNFLKKEHFTKKYMIAICFLALVSIVSFFLFRSFIFSQAEYGELINISGRQRMLSQKIGLESLKYLNEKESINKEKISLRLKASLKIFKESHTQIISGTWSKNKIPLSPESNKIYFSKNNLNELVEDYIKATRLILKGKRETSISITQLDKLLKTLNLAVLGFENELKSKNEFLYNIQIILFLVNIISLICVILFIFRPLTHTLEASFLSLDKERLNAIEARDLKVKFMASITHELRTPLNGIIGAIDLIYEDDKTKKNDEYLKVIDSCALISLHLVNDLLDFEKFKNRNFSITKEWIHLNTIVLLIKRQFSTMAKSNNIGLEFINNYQCTHIFTDGNRLKQIIYNLVSNAIKFTKVGGVKIEIQENKNQLLIKVSDTGIGIKEENLPKIFDEFFQEEQLNHKYQVGTGLGLSICKKLVILLGGNIQCESSLGKGSSFLVTLPMDFKDIINEKKESLSTCTTNSEYDLTKLNVLVIEDNTTNQFIFSKFLSKLGINFEMTNHGEEGLEACKREAFDIIFTDIQMPILDGIGFYDRLKIEFPHIKSPVVAFTANTQPSDLKKYKDHGFNYVLPKPVTLNELKGLIFKVLDCPESKGEG